MSLKPILVLGATGKTGRRVKVILKERGRHVRAVSRNSSPRFDWDNQDTWATVLDGVGTVYIVHTSLGTSDAANQIRDFAVQAASAGVERAVLVSTPDDGSGFSKAVRDAEQHITDAGLGLTSLRLRWFYQNFTEDFLHSSVLAGEIRVPAGTGKEAFVDARDIAEMAAVALTDDRHAGKFYDVTGPRLMSFADIAQTIAHATGRKINYVPLTPERYVAEQIALGVPADWAYTLSGIYQDIANGKLESVSGDVQATLGKPPRHFADFATEALRDGLWVRIE